MNQGLTFIYSLYCFLFQPIKNETFLNFYKALLFSYLTLTF